jgi:hypothetical protein
MSGRILATVGFHPSRRGRLALMRPDGSVSEWLSRHPAGEGTVVFALDEAVGRLTVSGPRALITDEVMRIARGFAWTRGADVVRFETDRRA